MTDTIKQDDPAAIERDIRRTQDDMSRTVDRIGDQLTPKKLFDSLLDKADENGVDTNYLIEGARRNPMALGLIAAGAIWLVSDKDSKFPSMPGSKSKSGDRDFEDDGSDSDVHHRDYVMHMSSFEMIENEDPLVYQRRRDQHRANFLMCERGHDEDDKSFRQRLDEMTDKFRDKRRAWSDSAGRKSSDIGRKAQQTAHQASERAQDLFAGNPLVTGMLAAALGAALGTTIPVSRTEREKLGGIGGKVRDMANQEKEALKSQAIDKKDELLEKADRKLQQSSDGQPNQGGGNTRQPGGENRSNQEASFMLPEGTR